MPEHPVVQGDCISSIAAYYGLPVEKVWEHPANADLRTKRKDPNVLFPGDIVFVPEKELRLEARATDQVHRFVKKRIPCKIRLRLLRGGQPRRKQEYVFRPEEGPLRRGSTDDEGWLQEWVEPHWTEAGLRIGSDPEAVLLIGHLDPVDEIKGAQGRLRNLGFWEGNLDGNLTDELRAALIRFQKVNCPSSTGDIDSDTKSALQDLHRS